MKIKYSNISSFNSYDLDEIKKTLKASINIAKKYGDSYFEIGKLSISFCSYSCDNGKINISSYINIKEGGCFLREERSINQLLKILKSIYPKIK